MESLFNLEVGLMTTPRNRMQEQLPMQGEGDKVPVLHCISLSRCTTKIGGYKTNVLSKDMNNDLLNRTNIAL